MLQNNSELDVLIKRIGCLFLSLGRIIELETDTEFTAEQYNQIFFLSKKYRYIDSGNMIKNPDQILKEFCYAANKNFLTIAQVGILKNEKTVFWSWAAKAYKDYKYMIEKVTTPGPAGTHFRLCNNKKELIYDSYSFTDYEFKKIEEYTLYSQLN